MRDHAVSCRAMGRGGWPIKLYGERIVGLHEDQRAHPSGWVVGVLALLSEVWASLGFG